MAVDFFSDSYRDARATFLDRAEAAGAQLQAFENTDARGPDGEQLFLDTAWFGDPGATTVLLNLSGTHGAEGFAGSAAQTAWIADGGPEALDGPVAVLMVHAANPFGFAHTLRCTEDNIDLNRNWIDHSKTPPENALYRELHPLLCPARIDEDALSEAARQVGALAEEHGQWTIDDALSRGQYDHADGYYYGGRGESWARRVLSGMVRDRLGSVRKVGLIDWHSGPVGDGELIYLCYADRASDSFARAQAWWGESNLDDSEVDRLWGGRRPGRHGLLADGIAALLPENAELTGGVIEFCSASPPEGPAGAFRIPMLERWMRFVGGFDSAQSDEFRGEIRNNYAPRRAHWEQRVIDNALSAYAATLDGLKAWAKG